MKLSERENTLAQLIRRRERALLDDLRLHVGIPTGANHRAGLEETRERLCSRLAALGAKIELVPGDPKPDWLFGVESGGGAGGGVGGWIPPTAVARRVRSDAPAGTRILVSGHMDTVHDPAGPFRELTISSDRATATGPGCVDMKGGLVIGVAALEALEEAGIACDWTVILDSDEETGSYHSEQALRAEARRHDVGLALEPAMADGGLVVERLGSGQFMLEAAGRAAHVGRDFASGVSAVTALAERLVAIGAMPDARRGMIVNIGPVEGGTATNVVPDRARAWGNVRFPSQEIADELGRMIDALATTHAAPPSVTVRRSFNRPAKPMTPGVERLALAARAAAEDLGQKLPFGKTGGVCDGNILQDEGLATIDTLGVRGGGLHTPTEWIELPSLVERCQLLAVLISRIAAAAHSGTRTQR